jgi:hypothetical protein
MAEADLAGMLRAMAGLSVALMLVIRLAIFWFAILIGVVELLLVQRMIGEPTDMAVVEVRVQARSKTSPEP